MQLEKNRSTQQNIVQQISFHSLRFRTRRNFRSVDFDFVNSSLYWQFNIDQPI